MRQPGEEFQVEKYMNELIALLKKRFDARLLYVGLQGSYLRGEATEESDIDVMVVLDELTVSDMADYRTAIETAGESERSCGFICGRGELESWNPLELCHLEHTTGDYYGKLSELLPVYTREDVRNGVKMNVCNLYHAICHRYIHAGRVQSEKRLPDAYKCVFFVLQSMYYLKTGVFAASKAELLPMLAEKDRQVLEMSIALKNHGRYDFDDAFSLLFDWCKAAMGEV